MWKKIWQSNSLLGFAAGLFAVLAFPPINLAPLCVFCPLLLTVISLRQTSVRRAARDGFLASLAIMGGAFYWVIYVIHVFGYLPWSVATLIYLAFCGFGALNLPLFSSAACWLQHRLPMHRPRFAVLWVTLGMPALFTVIEWAVPKLFPWYLGHAFYRTFWLNQIVELTGCSYLTFLTFSLGGALALLVERWPERRHFARPALGIAGSFWLIAIAFSMFRLMHPWPVGKTIKVALIQANIGSLEKVKARRGIVEKVRDVIGRYQGLTEQALREGPRPDLILWPETAVPLTLNNQTSFATDIKESVKRWNIPLITGGYIQSFTHFDRDYNAAYLLEPTNGGGLEMDVYRKNILLAFGEYLPFADLYPPLYAYVPQVSNFERGKTQNPFQLRDGTRIGVTICYEAIVPEFFRKVAANGVRLVVNLTNDSWFGPTAEPHQHAALSVFRAIETRLPMVRVTNTGVSFTVDTVGRMSPTTAVYEEGILHGEVAIPDEAPRTIYLRWGDWFDILCLLGLGALIWIGRRNQHASLSL